LKNRGKKIEKQRLRRRKGGGERKWLLHDDDGVKKRRNIKGKKRMGCWMMLMGSLSLIGFPFLTGFYSNKTSIKCVLY